VIITVYFVNKGDH